MGTHAVRPRRCYRLGLALMTVGLLGLPAAPAAADATITVGDWGMNEPSGATVMTDSGPHGIHGQIGSAIRTGVIHDGATGYFWPFTKPNEPPAKPERTIRVDDHRLNPGTDDYAVTIRFRTTQNFGNIIQKGQAGNPGGYFKFEIPKGTLKCLFRGRAPDGSILSKAVGSGPIPLNDGAWHTVRCERSADRLTMTIDGVRTRRALGPTGSISNNVPLSIGGKPNCDQIKITCDYFSGGIDYVRIERG